MWIYTSKAMVSIVQHNTKPNIVLVRARKQEHIVHFLATLPHLDYFYLENADYNWRAEINKIDLDRLVMHHLKEINYYDFKGSIPKSDQDYYHACHQAWHAMNNMSKELVYKDEPESEWIPCNHAMPEEAGTYLTRWSDRQIETYQFNNEGDECDGWFSPMGGTCITHWMEVPRFTEE